ncbi:MAG: tyrosine-protein phosphatase [Sarcina sp.]
MIDIHSHIIPEVDDGAKNIEVAISMLKKAEETKTKKIFLTPHYSEGKFNKTILEVKRLTEEIKKIAKENNISLEIYCGQEVFYTRNFLTNLRNGTIGTLNDSRYILIELDMGCFDRKVLGDLYELKLKGIVPIIAHPERYTEFIEKPELINEFIEEGALFQLDACSMGEDFGKDIKKTAEIFLKHNIYSFIGSDAHNTRSRTTNLDKYKSNISKINSKFIAESIKNGEKILENNKVIFKGEKIEKKGNFFFSLFIH